MIAVQGEDSLKQPGLVCEVIRVGGKTFLLLKSGAWNVRYFHQREAPSWTLPICPAPTLAPRDANPCLSESFSTTQMPMLTYLCGYLLLLFHQPPFTTFSTCIFYDTRLTASSALLSTMETSKLGYAFVHQV
jgi:hypothetical protein